jgi:hypothetical protein
MTWTTFAVVAAAVAAAAAAASAAAAAASAAVLMQLRVFVDGQLAGFSPIIFTTPLVRAKTPLENSSENGFVLFI